MLPSNSFSICGIIIVPCEHHLNALSCYVICSLFFLVSSHNYSVGLGGDDSFLDALIAFFSPGSQTQTLDGITKGLYILVEPVSFYCMILGRLPRLPFWRSPGMIWQDKCRVSAGFTKFFPSSDCRKNIKTQLKTFSCILLQQVCTPQSTFFYSSSLKFMGPPPQPATLLKPCLHLHE